ncbi:MAG: LapA family protein [Deltaproteobacteria bacterium]|nr:LapA family protein [Deltaproteobacteria bacterium]
MSARFGISVFFACLAAVFIVQNAAAVDVHFLIWRASLSLSLLIFFIVLFGFVIGWISHSLLSYRKSNDDASSSLGGSSL